MDTCVRGSEPEHGITNPANVVVLKSKQGTVTEADWERLLDRAGKVTMTPDNRVAVWHLVRHAHQDERIDARNTMRFIDTVAGRMDLSPMELIQLAYFMAGKEELQADARRYFVRAAEALPANSPLVTQLAADLEASGHPDWAQDVRAAAARGQQGGMPAD